MKTVTIRKKQSPGSAIHARYCDTFLSRLRGLMFTKELKPDQGIVLVENIESKAGTSIHMMFVNYDITVLWLDSSKRVVDKVIAKKWKPFYGPGKPAQYVAELHQSKFTEYLIGDQLEIIDENK